MKNRRQMACPPPPAKIRAHRKNPIRGDLDTTWKIKRPFFFFYFYPSSIKSYTKKRSPLSKNWTFLTKMRVYLLNPLMDRDAWWFVWKPTARGLQRCIVFVPTIFLWKVIRVWKKFTKLFSCTQKLLYLLTALADWFVLWLIWKPTWCASFRV